MRSVGAIYYGPDETGEHHDRRVVTEAYDGVLFVRETTQAVPITHDRLQ